MRVSELIALLQPYVAKGDPSVWWQPCDADSDLGCDLATGSITIDDFEATSDGAVLIIKLPEE